MCDQIAENLKYHISIWKLTKSERSGIFVSIVVELFTYIILVLDLVQPIKEKFGF